MAEHNMAELSRANEISDAATAAVCNSFAKRSNLLGRLFAIRIAAFENVISNRET